MRVPHYLVRRENGGFHFRKRIPRHLRHFFGNRVALKQSLRTHCMDTAKARAIVLSLRYDSFFSCIGPDMANPSIDDFPHLFKDDADFRKYKMKLPDGTEIDVRGAADHARAMEFLKAKSAGDLDLEVRRRATAEAEATAAAARAAAKRAEDAEIFKAMQPAPQSAPFERLKVAEASRLYEKATETLEEKEKKQNLKIVADFAEFAKIQYLDGISRPLVNAWITHLRDKVGNGDKTIRNKVE